MDMSKKILKVAMIGYGFMGKAHSTAYLEAQRIFDLPVNFEMTTIVGRNKQELERVKDQWGWLKATSDWKEAVTDPEIDVVDVTTPNNMHCEMVKLAAEHKKHVLCEKPLAMNVKQCCEMIKAVEDAKVLHLIWHNYRKAPAIGLAKRLIDENCLGRIYHIRGRFLQDWLVDPKSAFKWRHSKKIAGSGAHGDLNSHLIDMSRYLVGEISQVVGIMDTFVKERPDEDGDMKKVDVDDACAFLARFENGAMGVFESTRMAAGRLVNNFIEINGAYGSIYWDFEDMNSLQYFDNREKPDRRGFRKIQALTDAHPFTKDYWSAGHAQGYANTFINALRDFAIAFAKGENPEPNFYDGLKNQKVLDAVVSSIEKKNWEHV